MILNGLHFLLTYQCVFECDHCFVWGSPSQTGTLTLSNLRAMLQQAKGAGTVEWIYFEGGEAFMYYPVLAVGVAKASAMGFKVGIVTNGYWALEEEDAVEWLRPLASRIQNLSISSDLFHYSEAQSRQMQNTISAAEALGIPVGTISIARPENQTAGAEEGQIKLGESGVMYRGRAARVLASRAPQHGWETFTTCPFEHLREPGRVHVDPYGNLHICQGISIGNMLTDYRDFSNPLQEICARYDPDSHPIAGPLLAGGPVELVRRYEVEHGSLYADACHLCYETRSLLRPRFPEILGPDQMYYEKKEG
jgi:hypothetical protein